jgi:hypothetical protein
MPPLSNQPQNDPTTALVRPQECVPSGVQSVVVQPQPVPQSSSHGYSLEVLTIDQVSDLTPGGVVERVTEALNGYGGGGSAEQQDRLFEAHTAFVGRILLGGDCREAAKLWPNHIKDLVLERETVLNMPIHKGAPLYNTGLVFFVAGDFDRALQYFVEAGAADEALGRGHRIAVPIGGHPLSRQVILEPLAGLLNHWAANYMLVTGLALDLDELKSLLSLMADRSSDTLQAVIALHRIQHTLDGTENSGARIVRFRALADLVHLVESFLRQFQDKTIRGELGKRIEALLKFNSIVKKGRDDFRQAFDKQRIPNDDYVAVLNWITQETRSRCLYASSPAYAAGVITFFCHRLRNSLLHVNEEELLIFREKDTCLSAAGWVLAMLRVAGFAKERKFSTNDFP